jgi:hypothetical protein
MDRQPRYSKQEHARRGKEIYELDLRAQLEPENEGKIVAIDVDTKEFEVGENVISATRRLLARLPDAQIWCVRVGHRAVHRFGPRSMGASA